MTTTDHTTQRTYALPPDVALVPLADGSARLLNLAGDFYALPPAAAALLRGVLADGPARTAALTAAAHGVNAAVVRGDLDAFVADLAGRGLLRPTDAPAARPRPSRLYGLALRATFAAARSPRVRSWVLLALAYLAVRRLGWPRTVATWAAVRRASSVAPEAIDRAVRAATAWHPLPVACKERSLACWAQLRAAGVPAEVVVGVDFYPFASHCWCRAGGTVVADFADRCERYRPVFVYP